MRRLSFLAPLIMVGIWAIGMWILNDQYEVYSQACQIPCVWTRYSLGIPSALAASIGLIVQQRAFRRSGMIEFGRDSLAAAIAFAWYGVVGQLFVPISRLYPSTFLNEELFYDWFGFPVQVFRAVLAVFIAIFVIRFMRAFDTEIQKQIEDLQALQLEEARRREALRGGLIKRIVAAQEAERQRIARELHDDTGQALTALGLGLRGVSRTIKSDQNKAANNLRQLEVLVSNSLNELQRIIANLRPSHLDDLGLAAAIRWFISDTQNHTKLIMRFQQEGEERPVTGEVKIAIYRVVQEAITNAIKYSHGSEISIFLLFTDEAVSVTIEDDGVGMNLQDLRSRREQSWGLMGMQERAQLLDGQCVFESEPGKGMCVHVSIPYQLAETPIIEMETEND
jgi:signal transduction histidine kinase